MFATIGPEGEFTGFFPEELFPTPPEGAIEISHEQWLECIHNIGLRRWKDGALVEYAPVIPKVTQPVSARMFIRRFPKEKYAAVVVKAAKDAAEGDPTLSMILNDLIMSAMVDPSDADTIAGVQHLVEQGLITPEEAEVALSGDAP